MNTVTYRQFLACPAQKRFRISIKSTWIPDDEILPSSFLPANGSKRSPTWVFPIPLVLLSWHAVSLVSCLNFENRFLDCFLWPWLGRLMLSLSSWSFLKCNCTKIMGNTCHASNSLPWSMAIWAYKSPAHPKSRMNTCLCSTGFNELGPKAVKEGCLR